MPLDTLMNDAWNRKCVGWEYKFFFIPRRCYYSKKLIWLKYGYRGVAMWTGPGEPVFDVRWISSNEYLFAKIKGII